MRCYADILRELREDADLTQSEVYARYERGVNELPLHHLQTLCRYYHVSADYILCLPRELQWPR